MQLSREVVKLPRDLLKLEVRDAPTSLAAFRRGASILKQVIEDLAVVE